MSRLPSLAAVRAFEAAARLGNFTRAAAELGISQAAVSYQVKSLEIELGTTLFVRAHGRAAPTPAGAELSAQLTTAFETIGQAFDRLRAEDSALLTVSSFNSLAVRWLGGRLGAFQLSHERLAVRLTIEDGLTDFAREPVDVAIRGGMGTWPGLHAQFLMRVPFAPIASRGYVARHGPFDTPRQIAEGRMLSPEDSWWGLWFAEVGLGAPPPPPPGVRFDSQTIEGSAVLADQGIAMLNPVFWQDELREGRMVQLAEPLLARSSVWVVCREHQRNQAKIKAFRDWAVAEAENDPMARLIRSPPG